MSEDQASVQVNLIMMYFGGPGDFDSLVSATVTVNVLIDTETILQFKEKLTQQTDLVSYLERIPTDCWQVYSDSASPIEYLSNEAILTKDLIQYPLVVRPMPQTIEHVTLALTRCYPENYVDIESDFSRIGEETFSSLVEAVRNTRSSRFILSHGTKNISTNQMVSLAEAAADNTNITSWILVRCVTHEAIPDIANTLMRASHVTYIQCCYSPFLSNDEAGSESIALLAKAAFYGNLELKALQVAFGDDDPFKGNITSSCARALAMLKMRNEDIYFCDQTEACETRRRIDAAVAAASVFNEAVEQAVTQLQFALLNELQNNSQGEEIFAELRGISGKEHQRLLNLMPQLAERYKFTGGWPFLEQLPSFKNTDVSDCQVVPDIPEKTSRIMWMLGKAAYEEIEFRKFAIEIHDMLNAIEEEKDVQALFEMQGPDFMPCLEVPSFEVTGIISQEFNGKYRQFSDFNGYPAFRKEDSTGKLQEPPLYFIWDKGWSSWGFSKTLEDRGWTYSFYNQKLKARFYEDSEASSPYTNFEIQGEAHFSMHYSKLPLQDEVIQQLSLRENRADRGQFPVIMPSGDWVETILGPPKSLARCLEKGEKSLKDLNRCTMTFESCVFLVLAVKLVCHCVEARGGKIIVLKNKFKQFDQPPNVHLNFTLDDKGWIVEFQFTFLEYLNAKDKFHKFYEINRADSPISIASPIFNLLQDTYNPPSFPGMPERTYQLSANKLKPIS